MSHYSKDTIDKIGNSIIYLSNRIPDLSRTKLLKLLYLLEESSVIKYNIPFFGVKFEVWQAGPVCKEVYVDLSNPEQTLFRDYVNTQRNDDGSIFVTAKTDFIDDEFSDNDIELMDFIISKYGNKTAKQLVNLLHKKNSAWYKEAEKNNLLEPFEKELANSSCVEIDLSYYLSGCASEFYKETKEILGRIEAIKTTN